MPNFVHPALLWGLAAVALPPLIHLINMMRHRRIEWAAMEFLLASLRKHRTWIILKQLLLLLLRMLAVTMVVLLIAQPRLRSQWGGFLGGTPLHHIVLLDDSFSMSDRWADTDAFSEAKKVIERIAADALRQNRVQWFTLLRFSRAARPGRPPEPDMLKQAVGSDFEDSLQALLGKLKVSETAAGPAPALEAVAKLLGNVAQEQTIVYLLTDFRQREWNQPTELRKLLSRLKDAGAEIHLLACVDRQRPNLALVSLKPIEGIHAVGVPWFMSVTVRNYGTTPVRDVSVILSEDGHGRPGVILKEIPPGKTAEERFLVRFANPGTHEITARLESDAVAADNYRYFTLNLLPELPVLLIDGDTQARDARYLSFALAPSKSVRTGVRPQIETPRFLGLKPLEDFAAVTLTNISRLDLSAIEALEKYVASGGGVAFFLSERSDVKFFNESLHRGGEGLFPAPLWREAELLVDRLEPAPDLRPLEHFIFRVFSGKQNAFLQTVMVERYYALAKGWRPPSDSPIRVIARLRNGDPLAIEHRFGKGRVVAFLTTAAPVWNNWARNPSFVAAMLDLQAYLAEPRSEDRSRLVGAPLELRLDPAAYLTEARFVRPSETTPLVPVSAVRTPEGQWLVALDETDESGYYEARLTRTGGTAEVRRYAFNVDPHEGDLAYLDAEQLAVRLKGLKYTYESAAAFHSATMELAGQDVSEALLYALLVLLIGEQILAWSASYHPARHHASVHRGAARGGSG